MARKLWIKKALGTKRRRRGLRATGYTPKLHRHHKHKKAVRVEAAHKGALHRYAGVSLDHKFTASDLVHLERRAHHELDLAHRSGHHTAIDHALHNLRMVLFAKTALKHQREWFPHGKRSRHYTRR